MSIDQHVLTPSGDYVSLVEPVGNAFKISDIAHTLSQICRAGGRTRQFYSEAQHSVLLSQLVQVEYRLQALLHNAAAAYCGAVVEQMKDQERMGPYRAFELAMQERLFEAFGVVPTANSNAAIEHAYLQMRASERRDLMAPDTTPWPSLAGVLPRQASISPQMPITAEAMYLKRFKELTGVL